MVRGEVGPAREVDALDLRPADEHEGVSIRHGELHAHEVFLAGELLVEPVEPRGDVFSRDLLVVVGRVRLEQRGELLVDLGGEEVQPLLQAVALQCSGLGREAGVWLLVGEVLHDRRALGEDLAVIELERGHVAAAVHLPVIAAALDGLVLGIHLLQLERDAKLARHYVGGEGASTGCVIKLHKSTSYCVSKRFVMGFPKENRPSPSSASTSDAAIRNTGYSQPPLAALNTQPLPACTQVAPSRIGISASAATRVPMPATSSTPPINSAQNVT